MPAKKKEEKSVYYVGMRDPVELRRQILESSKEMIQYIQRAEKFKEIRKEKSEEIIKLKNLVSEIIRLVNKAKAELPKTNIRARLHKHEEKEKAKDKMLKREREKLEKAEMKKAKKIKEIEKKPKEMTELAKLEAELGEIESKLNRIA